MMRIKFQNIFAMICFFLSGISFTIELFPVRWTLGALFFIFGLASLYDGGE